MGTVIIDNQEQGLYVKRFWGGTDRGVCFQISVGPSYIQITLKEMVNIVTSLVKSLVVD